MGRLPACLPADLFADASITMFALVVDSFAPMTPRPPRRVPVSLLLQAGGASDTQTALKMPGTTRTPVDGLAVYRVPDGTASLSRQVRELL